MTVRHFTACHLAVRHPLVAMLVLLLAGCAGIPSAPPAPENNLEIKWREHQGQVAGIHQWNLSGRIGVRTDETGGSANLRWKRQEGHDQIDLFGPLGGGRIRLDIDAAGARLRDGQGQEFFAATGSEVLFKATGWYVPFEVLGDWVRGMPAAGVHEVEIDETGKLISLNQSGWTISFNDYVPHHQVLLPRKIRLSASEEVIDELAAQNQISTNRLVVKLYIDEWTPPAGMTEMDQ